MGTTAMMVHLLQHGPSHDIFVLVHAFIGTCEVLGLALLGFLTARARRKDREDNGQAPKPGALLQCPRCHRFSRFQPLDQGEEPGP